MFILLFPLTAYSQNSSISFDPFTLIGLLLPTGDQNHKEQTTDIRNLWLCIEANWEISNKTEMGVGMFWRGDRFALRAQWRNYFNKQRQSGAFIGLYGNAEWRQMYWLYDGEGIAIGWSFPFEFKDNVYHSLGITIGVDVGFRIRIGDVGITPFIGLGYPLFFCFGETPTNYRSEFDTKNMMFRAIDIGLRIDFFGSQRN
ncbi:MAG: hypothetical protein LBE74_08390 [Treponema sp.]|nr:hypothetical protein [Treponema sp.]